MAVIVVKRGWLAENWDPGFRGLANAITLRWAAQVGNNPRVWSATRSRVPSGHAVTGATYLSKRKPRAGSGALSYVHAQRLDAISECHALLEEYPEAAWGYESFQLHPGARSGEVLSPVAVAEALAYAEIAYGENARVPFTQTASMAKTTITDERLRYVGCYYTGMPHANDAMRHALLFARAARANPSLRAAAWPRLFPNTAKESA
jgi:hypothetical protein